MHGGFQQQGCSRVWGLVAAKVMQTYKVAKLFQTMAIMSLNMGNLTLGVNSLKNRLATWEKKKAVLHEELEKERDF
jgi:hypothetical protein